MACTPWPVKSWRLSVQVGDLIRFSSTGVQGVVTKISSDWVHVLCGNGEALSFPQFYITSAAEVINEAR